MFLTSKKEKKIENGFVPQLLFRNWQYTEPTGVIQLDLLYIWPRGPAENVSCQFLKKKLVVTIRHSKESEKNLKNLDPP